MKIAMKIIFLLLISLIITATISSNCLAAGSIITNVETEMNGITYENIKVEKIQNMASNIVKIIRYCAIIIGVILIAVFGIKFMLGSAEEKAEYKKSFIPLIVGIVVVFGSTYIAQVIFQIAAV